MPTSLFLFKGVGDGFKKRVDSAIRQRRGLVIVYSNGIINIVAASFKRHDDEQSEFDKDINIDLITILKFQHMPDVISDVQTMNENRSDDFMGDEHDQEQILAHLNNNANLHVRNLLNLDHLTHDPMLSAVSMQHQQQQLSTIDMSSIEPIITNYGLMSMHQHSNCDSASVNSILQSDSDSLISDIDMIT